MPFIKIVRSYNDQIEPQLLKKITQVLREADADLAGVGQRACHGILVSEEDIDAAAETRRNIASVYKELSGEDI